MPEDAGQSDAVRVCEYRRCGAPLPPAVGRGSRARFCQDGKTWGRRGLNCRDAEAVLSDAESLREADTQLDDTAVTALAQQVDRVLGPAAGLVDVLTTLRQQLEATTAAALAARDDAVAEADEHKRQRGRAEAEAAQARETAAEAVLKAADAERVCAEAIEERDHERAQREVAVEDRQRAEGKLAAVREELARIADRADAAAAVAGERATALAAANAELASIKTALAEEQARGNAAVSRAEAAEQRAAATAERLEAVREEFSQTVTAHRAALDAARSEIEQRRAAFDHRLGELQAGHEQTVRSMHETTTALGTELRTHTARADEAERGLARVLQVVSAYRKDLPDDVRALLPPEPPGP